MNQSEKPTPDPKAILNRMDGKKSESKYHKDQSFYTQGDPADCIYFIQTGKVKVAVVSPAGKEAVVGILQPGDFACSCDSRR
jgi:CRP/FNR family transcriptional regulator, cyclic AMP receptor protein